MNDTLTAVPGFRVGHYTDLVGITGCTVILCPPGTMGGVDQRGGAPGTRETDLLRPMHLVQSPTVILLGGGSAFGLAAADGVMRWCEAHTQGYHTLQEIIVPIVPGAILFDLTIGDPLARPTADDGFTACENATDLPVAEGNVGAGTGCRIGMIAGNQRATKGGLGSVAIKLPGGLIVAALFAVDSLGDVLDEDGQILGGLRSADEPDRYAGTLSFMTEQLALSLPPQNTVIGVIATNAALTNEQANKVAQMAQDGVARAVSPAHTLYDGDTIFTLASGAVQADATLVGAYAAEVTARAIRRGVRSAASLGGVRAWNDPISVP